MAYVYNLNKGALSGFIEQGAENDAVDKLVNNDAGEPQFATNGMGNLHIFHALFSGAKNCTILFGQLLK